MRNNVKNTIEFIKNEVPKLAPGYQCLSDVYINNLAKLNFRCDKGHEYPVAWAKFKGIKNKKGTRCPHCSDKAPLTIEIVKTRFTELNTNYKLLSTEYVNDSTKLNFVCDRGHNYPATWRNFQTGYRCRKCEYINRSGQNHPRYRHDLSKDQRLENIDRTYNLKNYHWRKAVYERDQYTCQYCNDTTSGNFNAHHIHNYADHEDLRFDIDNGITLCVTCHKEFHRLFGKRNNDQAQLDRWFRAKEKFLEIRIMMQDIDQRLKAIKKR